MKRSLEERLEACPKLKQQMENMLDVVENIDGRADKANDAEIQVVENARKFGATALQEWANNRSETASEQWAEEHPEAVKHGKKNFVGKQQREDENS